MNDQELRAIGFELAKKYMLYDAPPSVIDGYGAIVAQRVLAGIADPSLIFLMGRTDQIERGQRPFPIYTAIADVTQEQEQKQGAVARVASSKRYKWVEFTPFTVNFVDLPENAFGKIDTWAFGRTFDHRKHQSLNNPPPHSLGFGMGIWGSAGSIDIEQLWNTQIKHLLPGLLSSMFKAVSAEAPAGQELQVSPQKIDDLFNTTMQTTTYQKVSDTVLCGGRLFPAKVPNWTADVPGNHLVLVDAGIDFNIPLPPLFNKDRQVDVIIVNDASGDLHSRGPRELEKALDYLATKGIAYDRQKLRQDFDNKPFVVIYPENISRDPLLIYVPLRNQEPGTVTQYTAMCEYSTFNFNYSKENAERLIQISQNKIKNNEKEIIQVIDYFQEMRANNPQRVEFDNILEQLREKVKEVEAIIPDSRESTLVKQFIQHLVDLLKKHNNVVSPNDLAIAKLMIRDSVPAQIQSAKNRVEIGKLRNQIAHILFQIGQRAPGSGAAREVTGILEVVDSLLLEDRTLGDDDVQKVSDSLIQAQGELNLIKREKSGRE